MLVLHPSWVMDRIHTYYTADLDPEDIQENPISKDYQKLNETLKANGFYKSQPRFWIQENLKFLTLWMGMIYFAVFGPRNDVYYLLSALLAANLWHQAAFVAHDAGHSGITSNRKWDTLYGVFLADFFGGLSIGWWKHSHYVHHIITNDPEHDPDIQHLPFFSVTSRFTENLFSTFHNRELKFDRLAAVFVPFQHRLYYIILAFGRFNLFAQSWLHVLFHKQVYYRSFEIGCMMGYWVWFSWMLSHLPTGYHVFGYILVSFMVTFILHVQITLSHFGMSTEEPVGYEETFAERQLRTSMDIDCPEWLDWFHGGLQVFFY
jgi:delta8-fatty-acid desaturase